MRSQKLRTLARDETFNASSLTYFATGIKKDPVSELYRAAPVTLLMSLSSCECLSDQSAPVIMAPGHPAPVWHLPENIYGHWLPCVIV